MNKRGQGLSLNTIIIAAIVLVVLVVLWAIFTGRMGGFAGALQDTEGKQDTAESAVSGILSGDCSSVTTGANENTVGQVCKKTDNSCGKVTSAGTDPETYSCA